MVFRFQMKQMILQMNLKEGVAFLIAVMMTAMMMIFMSDLMLNSTVAVRMAVSQRDNLKAEYMAKSGFNLALMLITGRFLQGFIRI